MTTVSGSTKVTRNGRITIPLAVREALGLKEGDTVVVTVEEVDGQKRATLKSARAIIDELYGSVKPVIPQDEPLDVDELIRDAWQEAAVQRDLRSKRP
jgi:AbrB family looped-hinge helix DNA binding protein